MMQHTWRQLVSNIKQLIRCNYIMLHHLAISVNRNEPERNI